MHSARQHNKYAASGAHRWMVCHGSVKASAAVVVPPPSPWAEDGTEAHELLEFALKGRFRNSIEALCSFPQTWTHRADDEESRCDSVQVALDYVYELLDSYPDAILVCEHTATLRTPLTDDCGGTNDVCVIVPSLQLLYVVDFKHGAGVAVEVVENKQLLLYGLLAIDGMQDLLRAHQTTGFTITLAIVQPRAFHPAGPVREWLVPDGRFTRYLAEVEDAIIECEADKPTLTPGEEQCRWCVAKTTCVALEQKAMQAVSVNFASVRDVRQALLPQPHQIPADRLSYILQCQSMVEQWFADCYEHALSLAKAGHYIPGFKLVEADARRKWHGNEVDVAAKLMALTGAKADDVMPRKLIGITDAEAMVVAAYKEKAGKGKLTQAAKDARQAMALLTTKDTSGKLRLTEASDRRQAATVTSQFGPVALPPPSP